MPSRREVLLHGAIGAGFIASNVSGVTALAAAAPPLRRSLKGLAWNDPIVATYRDAVGMMKNRPAGDKFNWVVLSQIHGYDPDNFHYCPHGDWYFLPWHRAYTAMYERIVRKLTGNTGFAMPYWDWTADPLMPAVFLNPTLPNGKPNWLCVTDSGWTRTWPASKPMPPEIVGPAVLKKILAAKGYENFGTSRNPSQHDTNPSWVPAGGGAQGVLESTPHNNVHNNIGGWMPSASSPRDPIFFMHHANIDRIWALWNTTNTNSPDPLWTNMQFTNNFVNPDGTAWSPKVSDLYVPETLGYTYGLKRALRLPGPHFQALTTKLNTLFAIPAGAASPAVETVSVANTATAVPGRPLEVAIAVPPAALAAVRRRPPPPRPGNLTVMESLTEAEGNAAGTRALAFLRDVAITEPKTTMFRIFIDAPDVSENTPTTDPHYVGTFGVLSHGGHDGHGKLPSFVVDLTEAIQKVGGGADGKITLQLVPVTNEANGTRGTATPSRIEVSFIAN